MTYTPHIGLWVVLLETSAITTVHSFSFLTPGHQPSCKNRVLSVWEEKQGMCMCLLCICVCIFISCPSFHFTKHENWIWFLFTTGGRWHRATFQSALHFPVLSCRRAPETVFLTPRHCPSQLFGQPSSQHHPVTPPLSKCV